MRRLPQDWRGPDLLQAARPLTEDAVNLIVKWFLQGTFKTLPVGSPSKRKEATQRES